jgi:RNA polymerase sigma-70 factor (sigma-E family)
VTVGSRLPEDELLSGTTPQAGGTASSGRLPADHELDAAIGGAMMREVFAAPAGTRTEWLADGAVTELYSAHYWTLVRLASVVVRDISTAEEVVQDTFVSMAGGCQRLRESDKTLAYVRQAIVNRSRSVIRHRLVVDKNQQKQAPDMPSAEHGALTLLERSAVVSALRELTDRQRQVMVLRYYADLTEAEIAAAMGISRGAVKSHAARAMTALRQTLEPELA